MPTGVKLRDGHPTTITLSLAPNIALWEVGIQPMGVEGGEPIDQTTMRSSTWRQVIGRALKTLTPANLECAYDEGVYSDIVSQCNVNQQLTVTFPTGRTIVFWGFIRSFQPQKLMEGTRPLADVVVVPSNSDASGNEVAPVVGTTSSTTTTTTP